jgi:large subunit ribosomal protein L23Ae
MGFHTKNNLGVKKHTSRISVKFRRPKTKKLQRNKKYQKKLIDPINLKGYTKLFKHPITTESSMKKIQSSNTIILVFDSKAHKKNIKFLMEKIYKTNVIKINTLITPKGLKKAFIKLSPDQDALDVANKIGFI